MIQHDGQTLTIQQSELAHEYAKSFTRSKSNQELIIHESEDEVGIALHTYLNGLLVGTESLQPIRIEGPAAIGGKNTPEVAHDLAKLAIIYGLAILIYALFLFLFHVQSFMLPMIFGLVAWLAYRKWHTGSILE